MSINCGLWILTEYIHTLKLSQIEKSFTQWTNRTSIDCLIFGRFTVHIHFQQLKFEFEFVDSSWSCFLFLLILSFLYSDTWLNKIIPRVTINWQYNPSNQNVNNENRRRIICSLLFFELRAVGVKFSWQYVLILIVHRSPFTIHIANEQKQKMNKMSSFIFVHHLIDLIMAKAPPTTTMELNLI